MTVKDAIRMFESKFNDLKVKEIYSINRNECLIIAPRRDANVGSGSSPNTYILNKNGNITPINPTDDLETFVKITSSKNRIYDAMR